MELKQVPRQPGVRVIYFMLLLKEHQQICAALLGDSGDRCPALECKNPLQPVGHCCTICGECRVRLIGCLASLLFVIPAASAPGLEWWCSALGEGRPWLALYPTAVLAAGLRDGKVGETERDMETCVHQFRA